MMTELDDIFKAQAGDREAFGRLVTRYHDLVYGICYGMTAQAVDAEDLAHEAFVEAFLKLRTVREPERFAGWLRTLTLNVCRMWHRQKKRVCPDGLAELEQKDISKHTQLNGYFAKLSESHRMALALHYWEGLSYEEMARFLEIPIGTVMSRLSRAKQALKDVMEQNEDMNMDDGDGRDLQFEVDAEIEVLLKLFGDDVDSMERLSIVLEKSPDRFRQVIQQVEDGATVEQVAMLVRHFGQPAVEATIGCYFDGGAEDKAKAFAVLQRLIAHWEDRARPDKKWMMPLLPEGYLILDAINRSSESLGTRLELLVDMIEIEENHAGLLFEEVLRGYGDPAFKLLVERFKEIHNPQDRRSNGHLWGAIRLFGSQFLEVLVAFLQASDHKQVLLGLRGTESVVGLMNPHWLDDVSPDHRRLERRGRGALFVEHMDAQIMARVTQAIVALMAHSDTDIRAWAVAILEKLPVGSHLSELRACLNHKDRATRLAAMKTLAALNDRGCIPDLITCAQTQTGLEQRRAIEALGQLRASAAQPALLTLMTTKDVEIKLAAILALGNVGDEQARNKLKTLVTSSDKKVARAAASALYGGRRQSGKMSALRRARLEKIRGKAGPYHGAVFRSVVAAVHSLPELRVYEERELTYLIAQTCSDYSTTRRSLVSGPSRLMTRDHGMYAFTPLGEAVWRVERFIHERFVDLERY